MFSYLFVSLKSFYLLNSVLCFMVGVLFSWQVSVNAVKAKVNVAVA